jgi:Ca-activated chloride channel family protein
MKRVALVASVLAAVLVGALVVRVAVFDDLPPVVVVHWSNSHPMRDGLLPEMAEEFNGAGHKTASGHPIQIVVISCDSSVQADDLVSRVRGVGRAEDSCGADTPAPDPTIVTPQSSDWLVDVNHRAERSVVDLNVTHNIAETWLGIVTYREMAECLGWPDAEVGYADILALRADPDGWAKFPDCARTEWGRQPLLAVTNPNTSTSGRNVLVSLYSIAAGKPPGELTVTDIERPDVMQYVKEFQQLVDHYLPGTIPLNTKIVQGPRYGHFFLMPEDNLVSLYKGTEKGIAADGTEQPIDAVTDLVMIYPKEGSVLNSNPAGLVNATWVSEEHIDAAHEWIDHLREERQQRKFMDAGFRPATGTDFSIDERQYASWGLAAQPPNSRIEPGQLQPAVLDHIISSWGAVKKPAIVTFVVDVSGSMNGEPLAQVKDGLTRLVDAMADSANQGPENQVGLVTFSDAVHIEIAPSPIQESKYKIADAIIGMRAKGETALFDAVQRAVALTDGVAGDPRATRAVVVLSDGAATAGTCLHTIVSMMSRDENAVEGFCGMQDERPVDDEGRQILVEDVNGGTLLLPHKDPVQVFFVGFGDADVHIGRILAEATGAEYQGSTDEDLATVIEELSGYF